MAYSMTPSESLSLAWTYLAPGREQSAFPHGFWPDVARVAMAMFEQQSTDPKLDFRPTRCERGNYPERVIAKRKFVGLDLDKLEINL